MNRRRSLQWAVLLSGPAIGLAFAAPCAARDATVRTVPLHYDPALVKADFPNPAARLTFNGRTAWFLFDTGAGVHTFARWFADSAGLEIDTTLSGVVRAKDSTGQPVPFRAVRDQVGRLENGGELTLRVSLVADFTPEFKEMEVGGVVNPQLLAAEGEAAVLDLPAPRLTFEPWSDAVRRVGASTVPADNVTVCGSRSSPVPNLVFALRAKNREAQGWLLLDTGAGETTLWRGSPLAPRGKLEKGRETVGAAGKRRRFYIARNVTLNFAGQQMTMDPRVVRDPPGGCGKDGMLGLDALSPCDLVLGEDSLAIKCP